MKIPFFDALSDSKSILIAGAGGGFDVASGIPIYLYLRKLGKPVVLANLSFTALPSTDSEEICPGTYRITQESRDIPYFPEKFILEWLSTRGENPDIYACSNKLGVIPLGHAYSVITQKYGIDTLILVDGGTDSLMFGDEVGVGTIVEDACSIIAAAKVPIAHRYLVATGFGVDYFHDLNHHACLENIATLTRDGAYLGAIALTQDMDEGRDYLELVEYLNQRLPGYMSIVANSIASAIRGEFGNFHVTPRTKGSELFINPFMGLFWFFQLRGVAARIAFASKIDTSETMHEVAQGFRLFRAMTTRRTPKNIPL
ncbi:DUF1152 domain-containing protein [Methylomagnum ishizawai]|uniref:DUF1152 domain-containing protein n=1 Tax=Methylomagnum ishizawai TaxID=1760988 RepID=UPI001C33AA14|nr:DUF1152 domain-containing protein [Methylomagnum ishizawai]BBL75549.1 hypothetical protein MishRS11D_26470 [Methylomagnum ishizawai]